MNWPAILLSLRLAVTVCGVLLVLGAPLAYWIAFSPRRWKFLIEAIVALPLAKAGVITGAVLSFAHTIGEFGVVLMVGGNIPGVTQTISIAIYDEVQALDYAVAARTSALLLVFSFVTLTFVYGLNRRASIWWSSPRHA